MGDDIVFKGIRDGLQLLFNERAEFSDVLAQLQSKLSSAFFTAGATIKLPPAIQCLTPVQQGQLTDILEEKGLQWTVSDLQQQNLQKELGAQVDKVDSDVQSLVVNKTLRGGQRVAHSGSIIVFGDVNPGAEVMAGGDIVITGTCRGKVYAGNGGNESSTITAKMLLASQIRIAGLIAIAPDKMDKPEYAETARIRDGIVIIEPAINEEGIHRWGK